MIRAVIFDWHGVLDRVTFGQFLEKLAETAKNSSKEVRKLIHYHERMYIAGKISPEVFWDSVQKILGLTREEIECPRKYLLSYEQNHEVWNLIIEKIPWRVPLAILSDCPCDKITIIRTFASLSIFNKVFFSGETGLLKDDPEFFCMATEDLVIKDWMFEYDECLYVDDSLQHVNMARSLGFHAHHFTETHLLEKKLEQTSFR